MKFVTVVKFHWTAVFLRISDTIRGNIYFAGDGTYNVKYILH